MHIYCGDGKGKTTAAAGLALRAAAAGEKVVFAQFMKGGRSGEVVTLSQLEQVTILRSEKNFPFYEEMTELQKAELTDIHNAILEELTARVNDGNCGLAVLDEITYPWNWGLIDIEKLQSFLQNAKGRAEVVCTGRDPADFLLEQADYITEMKCIRHPFEKGVAAREGVEY
ncbi:MAG: cob(I)yrinic acid a,c-diamide adenosyltransferase [Lachnospiraceae bacterium]|nr:cob(I)yrinic acid a,c-diamide adenosyltransferase [Lachnospiraceae bacterium]